MNGITIMLIAIAVLGGGYLLYGRWLAKLWGVDPKAKTPAYEMEDGVDYPLGCLLPILFPKLKPKHIILIGCLCSIATEATQCLLKMGWCETDDVIHNTLGITIGVWVWLWQSKRLNAQRIANPGKGEV